MRRLLLGTRTTIAGTVYGTIVVLAAIAASAATYQDDLWRLAAVVLVTVLVLWLAHVYAQALSHHLRGAKRLAWPVVREAMIEERALLEGPLPLLVVLALGALGVLDERLTIRLAPWLGVAQLLTWGILYARRQRWGWPTALTAGAINGTFGLLIVLLEVVVH